MVRGKVASTFGRGGQGRYEGLLVADSGKETEEGTEHLQFSLGRLQQRQLQLLGTFPDPRWMLPSRRAMELTHSTQPTNQHQLNPSLPSLPAHMIHGPCAAPVHGIPNRAPSHTLSHLPSPTGTATQRTSRNRPSGPVWISASSFVSWFPHPRLHDLNVHLHPKSNPSHPNQSQPRIEAHGPLDSTTAPAPTPFTTTQISDPCRAALGLPACLLQAHDHPPTYPTHPPVAAQLRGTKGGARTTDKEQSNKKKEGQSHPARWGSAEPISICPPNGPLAKLVGGDHVVVCVSLP